MIPKNLGFTNFVSTQLLQPVEQALAPFRTDADNLVTDHRVLEKSGNKLKQLVPLIHNAIIHNNLDQIIAEESAPEIDRTISLHNSRESLVIDQLFTILDSIAQLKPSLDKHIQEDSQVQEPLSKGKSNEIVVDLESDIKTKAPEISKALDQFHRVIESTFEKANEALRAILRALPKGSKLADLIDRKLVQHEDISFKKTSII